LDAWVSLRMLRNRRSLSRQRSRGQSLAEFAVVFPVLMLVLGGIIQFGIIFWGQNTLNQVVRDTARWAATQQGDCETGSGKAAEELLIESTADDIASASSLIGFDGSFDAGDVIVSWTGTPCPPNDNQDEAWVDITISHTVPIFFPFVPGNGQMSSATEFRMEPKPE
jgi:hypothetical protein